MRFLAGFGFGVALRPRAPWPRPEPRPAASSSSSSPAGTSSAVVSAIRATAFAVQSSFSIRPSRLKRLVELGDLVVGEIGDLLELDEAELVQLGLELQA